MFHKFLFRNDDLGCMHCSYCYCVGCVSSCWDAIRSLSPLHRYPAGPALEACPNGTIILFFLQYLMEMTDDFFACCFFRFLLSNITQFCTNTGGGLSGLMHEILVHCAFDTTIFFLVPDCHWKNKIKNMCPVQGSNHGLYQDQHPGNYMLTATLPNHMCPYSYLACQSSLKPVWVPYLAFC